MLKFSAYGKSFLTYINSARPRDIQPLGARILQIRGFYLDPKTLDIHGFCPKALKKCVFYVDFDLKPWKYQLHNALFLRYTVFSGTTT